MKFFKPEDFDLHVPPSKRSQTAADTANAKLEREGLVLYQQEEKSMWSKYMGSEITHKALLINIDPINPCSHPKEKIRLYHPKNNVSNHEELLWFQCECGARVVPSSFEETR